MRFLKYLSLIAMLLAAGCGKKQPPVATIAPAPDTRVTLVPANERSAHFAAVNQHLELGGKLYGYVDVDGDTLRLAEGLRRLADNIAEAQPAAAPFLKQDFAKIFDELGLSDIKAAGLSSVQEANGGFRNRVFFYTPNGRHGLLAGLGGPAAPYAYAKLAPADADFFSEAEIDLPAVYAAIKTVVTRIGGETTANLMDSQLKAAGAPAGLSALEVIQSIKGRVVAVMRLDPEKNISLPSAKPVQIPAFSLLLRIDGVGGALQQALTKLPMLEASQDGTVKIFAFKGDLPLEGIKPVLAVDGSTLYVATSIGFFNECRQRQSGLDQSSEFQQALASVGREGNGLVYLSPRFFARLRQLPAINADAEPELKRMLELIVAQVPEVNHPLIAERINLPDGILVRSQWNRSLKQDLALITVYNPVTVGLMAAMAIPAFQKVREASQEKVIQNNLRQFRAGAEQHMMESGRDSASYADVVGVGRFIPGLKPVAGEDYTRLVLRQTDHSLSVRTAAGRVIVYRW